MTNVIPTTGPSGGSDINRRQSMAVGGGLGSGLSAGFSAGLGGLFGSSKKRVHEDRHQNWQGKSLSRSQL